jgi:hypothetical protein
MTDLFSVSFLMFAAVFFGGTFVVALAALFRVRHAHRDRLEMRQHLRNIQLHSK